MKKKFVFPFLLLLSLIISSDCCATHAAGAEVTYTHISGSMYKLKLAFYRDCFGIAGPAMVSINVHSNSCSYDSDYTLLPLAGTGTEISNTCPGVFTICTSGNQPGYQKYEYEADISLGQCADWVFTFDTSAINGCGTVNPGSPMIVQAKLNNSISDNNTPQFLNNPEFNVCANQDFYFNNGVNDPDGDSLVYLFADAIGVTYIPPYSGQYPFTSLPPATFDTVTGNFFGHATTLGCALITFEIREYRNGIFMGSVIREFDAYFGSCTNSIPAESGMNGTSQHIAYVLPNDTICFDILSSDADAAQILAMTWDQAIPSASFTTAGSPHPTGTFCWTPSVNDVRSQPYMFTSIIKDNNCPLEGVGIYSFFIYVTLDSSLVFIDDSELSSNYDISIYPNPSDGKFMLSSVDNISSIKIFDRSGKIIQAFKPRENHIILNAPDGVYWIEIIYDDGRRLDQKLLVKK